MKKKLILGLALVLPLLIMGKVQASTIFDDFNDGNTDGWISAPPCASCPLGNWRLSEGIIIEDYGRDAYMFLLENYPMSSQSVEAKILNHDNGYAGITVWYKDVNNWVQVFFPYWNTSFGITEMINGYSSVSTFPYQFGERIWRTMKIDADSNSGELAIYLDGDHVATHSVSTNNRTGLSGFNSRNAGGKFDDFKLTELDSDNDGVSNEEDNCVDVSNADQANYDSDEFGDACDTDDDNDSVLDENDCAPTNEEIILESGTKACQLWTSGIIGKGIFTAPGLQKP